MSGNGPRKVWKKQQNEKIAEDDDLFYMMHGDVTYTDEALYENKLSVVYEDSVCGYVYDPAENNGIAFENLPEDWKCPRCKQPKTEFNAA